MRQVTAGVGLATVLLLAGCNHWPGTRPTQQDVVRIPQGKPTAVQLVKYLNENSQRIQTLECRDLSLDVRGPQVPTGVGLSGMMACEKPRNFRLTAKLLGQPNVDLGSNNQEFWFWIGKADPHLFHCSYEDYRRGARMPFPFQPEWVMEALGMGEYDPAKNYELVEKQTTLELVEKTTSAQGQPVRKVTVFNRGQVAAGRPQVIAHVLQDANGKDICSAHISEVQSIRVDQYSTAMVPRVVVLKWPQEQTELKLKLDKVGLAAIDQQRAASLFSRRGLSNIPTYDLARGPDAPSGPVQRIGGPMPR